MALLKAVTAPERRDRRWRDDCAVQRGGIRDCLVATERLSQR